LCVKIAECGFAHVLPPFPPRLHIALFRLGSRVFRALERGLIIRQTITLLTGTQDFLILAEEPQKKGR
jgi:hypothetical protein